MKRNTWIGLFIFAVIGIIILLWIAFRNNNKREKCPDGKTPVPKNGKCPQDSIDNSVSDELGCVPPSEYVNFSYPIRKGMKDGGNVYDNKQVSVLQSQLNKKYNANLGVDGFFGCKTESAVKRFLGITEVGATNPIWKS